MNRSVYPDYYPDFRCAMGQCRLNCCRENWQIPLTREEYETIRAAARREKGPLAEQIGAALAREGSPEGAYAHIRHGKNGACPLCSEEGLCRLHAACGPEALGSVCRTFPRSHVLWGSRHRQCCSAGCQATIALLKEREQPITFVEGPFVADGWAEDRGTCMVPAARLEERPLLARLEEVQTGLAACLQQRQKPMGQRMAELCDLLYRLEQAEQRGDREAALDPAGGKAARGKMDFRGALAAVTLFTTVFHQQGSGEEQALIRDVWQACGVAFVPAEGGAALSLDLKTYLAACEAREALWEREAPFLWEHLAVNQLFQDRLPFGNGQNSLWENTLYFAACYAILRFLAAGTAHLGWQATEDALVRGLRKFGHSTELMPRTVQQLRRRGMDTPAGLDALLAL